MHVPGQVNLAQRTDLISSRGPTVKFLVSFPFYATQIDEKTEEKSKVKGLCIFSSRSRAFHIE